MRNLKYARVRVEASLAEELNMLEVSERIEEILNLSNNFSKGSGSASQPIRRKSWSWKKETCEKACREARQSPHY